MGHKIYLFSEREKLPSSTMDIRDLDGVVECMAKASYSDGDIEDSELDAADCLRSVLDSRRGIESIFGMMSDGEQAQLGRLLNVVTLTNDSSSLSAYRDLFMDIGEQVLLRQYRKFFYVVEPVIKRVLEDKFGD